MRHATRGTAAARRVKGCVRAWRRTTQPISVPAFLLAWSAIAYAVSTVLLLCFWQPGRGIGATFYLAIVLAAMATGPLVGAAAGAFASVLYWSGLILGFDRPLGIVTSSAGAIHLFNFVLVGVVVGYFARRTRHMLRDSLGVLDDLLVLAGRDLVTGAGNPDAFQAAVSQRLKEQTPFALLLASAPEQSQARGRAGENDLRSVATALHRALQPQDELAHVGSNEFAMLVSCAGARAAEALAAQFERALDDAGFRLSIGWASPSRDSASVLELYSAASARLYARRAVRGEWNPTAASASLVESLESRRQAIGPTTETRLAATNT